MRHSKACATALGLLLALAAAPGHAQIVYSGLVNLEIPNTSTGLYVNVLDGSTFTGPGVFPVLGGPGANYDFNIFGTAAWTFFSPGTSGQSAPTVPAASKGYVSASPTGAVTPLAFGTLIDNDSVFNTGSPSGALMSTGEPVYFGFRFRNEGPDLTTAADDTVHFGWAQVVLTAGQPGLLIAYAFEATPLTGIGAGVIPEPGSYALMGLGLAGLLAWRRRTLSRA